MKKIVVLFFLAVSLCFSKEDYLTKVEFMTKLSAYFSYNQLESIYKKLPEEIQVWGYDVGDYSGDKLDDCAFSFRMMKDTKKNMTIMFFINLKDSFLLADNYELQFSVLPIEIGFNIQNSECHVTHKLDEEYWEIKSYSLVNGNFKLTGYYESKNEMIKGSRRKFLGYEKSFNFKNSMVYENYYDLASGKKYFKRNYYFLSCYKAGRPVFKDYVSTICDSNSVFITSGYLNWKDKNDLQISCKATYNDNNLYFDFLIYDDVFLDSDSSETRDKLILWFDSEPDKLIFTKRDGVYVREGEDEFIKKIEVNFDNKKREYASNESDNNKLEIMIRKILKNHYFCRVAIPFSSLNIQPDISRLGFGWQYYDYDEKTNKDFSIMASSNFEEWNPSSLGEILLIKDNEYFGTLINFELPKALLELKKFGVIRKESAM